MGIQWKHASAEAPGWECRIGSFIKLSGECALDDDVIGQAEKAAWQRRMVIMEAPDDAVVWHPAAVEYVPIGIAKADLLAHHPTPEILESIGWA